MIPETVGRKFNVGKVALVQCVKNDTLKDFEAFTNYTPTAFRDMAVAERKAALQK